MILLISLIALTGCSVKNPAPTVTKYKFVNSDIPQELLRCEKAPNPNILRGVAFLKGANKAKRYTKALVLTNYKNCQKLKAIKKLVEDNNDANR